MVEYLNSGQICLKVNRVSVHPAVQRKLVERMPSYLNEFNKKGDTDCMTHIVNEKNSDGLKELLEKSHQGKIEYGGELDALQNRITPRDGCQVLESTSVLFKKPGSICPILTSTTQEAIDLINSLPRPLAIYLSSQDEEIDHVISSTISGGITVNGVITHATVPQPRSAALRTPNVDTTMASTGLRLFLTSESLQSHSQECITPAATVFSRPGQICVRPNKSWNPERFVSGRREARCYKRICSQALCSSPQGIGMSGSCGINRLPDGSTMRRPSCCGGCGGLYLVVSVF